MIVFDLRCAGQGHVFEAWFGSSRDYDDQRARGLIACPLCGDGDVAKAVTAAGIPAKGNARTERKQAVALPDAGDPSPAKIKKMLGEMAKAQAAMLEKSDWVGPKFAEQARAMHVGDIDQRAIHGQATVAEARAMVEDGVPLAPLPFPVQPPDTLN